MSEPRSVVWPLLFSYRGMIAGRGFLAEIDLRGRLLATPDVDGIWLYGVKPGALAVEATTLAEANVELHQTLTRVFIDFAEQAQSFEGFKRTVERFFDEVDADTDREWRDAVAAVQAGQIPLPEGLPKYPADSDRFVRVTSKLIETVTPRDNLLSQQEAGQQLAAVA